MELQLRYSLVAILSWEVRKGGHKMELQSYVVTLQSSTNAIFSVMPSLYCRPRLHALPSRQLWYLVFIQANLLQVLAKDRWL